MKNIRRFILLLALIVGAPLQAEPIKIKFTALVELASSLREMDGTEKIVETKDQGTRVVRIAYDLSPSARLAIARDFTAVKGALEAFETVRQTNLAKVSPAAPEKVQSDPALLAKFVALWNATIAEPVTIDVSFLAEEQLNLSVNALPPTIISGLSPVLSKKPALTSAP